MSLQESIDQDSEIEVISGYIFMYQGLKLRSKELRVHKQFLGLFFNFIHFMCILPAYISVCLQTL